MDDEDAPPDQRGDAMLYDYFKHLTSLCLFSLAGVAALADKVHGRSTTLVLMTLLVIGLAGFSSFVATGLVVTSLRSGTPLDRNIHLYRHTTAMLLAVGIGMFLYVFVTSLKP
jgi:hypothetical protein